MKKFNLLIVTLVFFVSFCFISPSNIVMADTATYKILDWDDFTASLDTISGNNDYLEWERESGENFQVADNQTCHPDDTNSLYMENVYTTSDFGWINLTTNFSYISEISMWFYLSTQSGDPYGDTVITFYDDDMSEVLKVTFQDGAINDDEYYITDASNAKHYFWEDGNGGLGISHLIINHSSSNIMNYTLNSGVINYAFDATSRESVEWDNFRYIYFYGSIAQLWIGRLTVKTDDAPGAGDEGTIYLKVYDALTGDQFRLEGSNVNDATYEDRLWPKVESDLWSGEYDPNMNVYTLTITSTFDEGSTNTLELNGFYDNNIFGYVNGVSKNWWEFTATFKWYKGQTYSFTVTSTDAGQAGFSNCADTNWFSSAGCMDNTDYHIICTDKDTYAIGERIFLKWYFPSKSWLSQYGEDLVDGWELELWDENEITWNPISNYHEGSDWFAPGQCDWVYFDILVDADFKNEYNEYKFQLVNREPFFDFTAGEVFFHCTGNEINPEADILYITPDPATTFQSTSMAWISNCSVKITIERLGSGDEPDIYYDQNRNGTAFLNITYWLPGTYMARIYGFDGIGYNPNPLDSLLFNVTGDQAPWPGAEYLEVMGDPYYIAGQIGRNVTLRFKTLVDEANLTVVMPNGGTSMFSRLVNKSDYIHSFWLPPGAPIGEWTVTLYAQGTHVNYFHVISEEGNYIEFGQNVFYDEQYFSIILKHSHYVGITFFKDGVAQGETWRLEPNEHAKELTPILVPSQYARASLGNWRVEMWRLNEENIVKLLSADNCTVVSRPQTPYTPETGELGNLIQNAFPDPTMRGIIGLAICLVITFMPFLTSLKMKQKHITINVPTILYAICFEVGVIVSFVTGFFGVEILFFLTVMLVGVVVSMYLFGKKSASSGSDA